MIGKVRKGDCFLGLVRYLTRDGRGQVLGLDNLASHSPEAAAREMTVAAAVSRRTKSPVLHLSISYAAAEHVTLGQMREDARQVLRALGLGEHQAVIIEHHDANHRHLHVMANRVGSDGKTQTDSQSYPRVEAALRAIEAARGWAPVAGRHAPSPTTGQRMTGHRCSTDPRQHTVPDRVRRALLTAETWAILHRDIRSAGWRLEIIQRGKGSGALLIGPNGERVAAGKIDRGASLTGLRRRLGRDPETRKRALEHLTSRRTGQARRAFRKAAGAAVAGALAPFLVPGFQPTYRPRQSRRRSAAPRL